MGGTSWIRGFLAFLFLVGQLSVVATAGAQVPPSFKKEVPQAIGADPLLEKAWHLKRIGAFEAWKTTEGSQNITIAIVDSGINYNHPDLWPNIRVNPREIGSNGLDDESNGFIDDIIGWDFVRGHFLPFDRSGHGTFIAGIAAASKDNGIGSAGVCPRCRLLPVRFLNYEGMGDDEDALKALHYAINSGASVINYSVSGEGYDRELHSLLKEALTKNIVVVVAASNDGCNLDYESIYPAKFKLPNLLTIAASDRADSLLEDSNWGKRSVHFAAPGDEIVSTYFDGYDEGSGTSDAAAVVAGAVGLVRSAAPHLNASQVVEILLATVRPVSGLKGKMIQPGILDVAASTRCATDPALSCLKEE